jgi:hypothetical protein
MKDIIRKNYLLDKLAGAIFQAIVFFYIYSVQFIGIPKQLGTRALLGLLGAAQFALHFLARRSYKQLKLNKHLSYLLAALALIPFITVMSLVVNGTRDREFVNYASSIVLIAFAGYFVVNSINAYYREKATQKLIAFIITATLVQVIIALVSFLQPTLSTILTNIQVATGDDQLLDEVAEFRLVGFGAKFFGAGIVNGFTLILIATVIKVEKISKGRTLYYSICYLIILFFGMMMARSTMIGGALGLGVLFFPTHVKKLPSKRAISQRVFFLSGLILIPVLAIAIVFLYFPSLADQLESAFNFGFELFVNYSNGNELESKSTSQLQDMYVWPTSIKTYLIGDGYYADPLDPSLYYMGTDVGIIRLIYYFGVTGLVVYLLFQFAAMRYALKVTPKFTIFFLVLFLYLVILNFKGFTDLFYLVFLFCMLSEWSDKHVQDTMYNK